MTLPHFIRDAGTPMTDNAPGGRGFVTLLEAFRARVGTALGDIDTDLLKDCRVVEAVSLARLVRSGEMFGLERRCNLFMARFQFNADVLSRASAPWSARAQLLELLSGWTMAMWFAMPSSRLGGCGPVDAR